MQSLANSVRDSQKNAHRGQSIHLRRIKVDCTAGDSKERTIEEGMMEERHFSRAKQGPEYGDDFHLSLILWPESGKKACEEDEETGTSCSLIP